MNCVSGPFESTPFLQESRLWARVVARRHVEALAAALSDHEETATCIFVPAEPLTQSPPTALQILFDDSHPRAVGKYQLPCPIWLVGQINRCIMPVNAIQKLKPKGHFLF